MASSSVWFLYILRCADDSLYIGETSDVDRRLAKHNDGTASVFTAARRPVTLIHAEQFQSRHEALTREQQLKRWTRAKKEALVAGDLARLKRR